MWFGARTIATLGYENDPDRTTVLAGFDTPRLIANRVGVGASYSRRWDGHAAGAAAQLSVLQPFVGTRWVAELGVVRRPRAALRGRLRFPGGFGPTELRDPARRRGQGSERELARLRARGAPGQVVRDDFGEESTAELPRTITVAAGPYVTLRRPRYIQVRNYEAMGRIEDVDLGPSARADVTVAPAAWGCERDGVGGRLAASAGLRVPAGFAQLGASASGLHTSAGTDSSTLDASLLTVIQPNELHLIVARVAAGQLNNPPFGTEYDLGLGYAVARFRRTRSRATGTT